MGPLFRNGSVPSYHDAMLFVRMKPQQPQANFTAAFAAARTSFGNGLQALSYFERAGLVKRVTPVSRSTHHFTSRVLARATGNATLERLRGGLTMELPPLASLGGLEGWSAPTLNLNAATDDRTPGGTTSLVELAAGVDVQQLQLALAGDSTVASVSRVPLRYLVARIPHRAKAASHGRIMAAPPPTGSMWNLRTIKWVETRALAGFNDGAAIKVAVLDTGIDVGHPDLKDQIGGYVYEHPDLPSVSSNQDLIGHGTHVAGTISAAVNNGIGVSGISGAQIHAWKIFDDRPDLLTYSNGAAEYVYFVDPVMYLRALLDCADAGIDVVNLSIGGGGQPDPTESEAFRALLEGGTTVVAAMGNEREEGSPISYPAAIPGVIAVGATNIQDRVTRFSNRGNHIALSAPGDAIWSTLPTYPGQMGWTAERESDGRWKQGKATRRETDYDAWPGTSMASPHIAAAVALYLANGGQRSPRMILAALAASADKVPQMGGQDFTPDHGYGRLNLERLILSALRGE